MTSDDDARLQRRDVLAGVESVAPSAQKAGKHGSHLFRIPCPALTSCVLKQCKVGVYSLLHSHSHRDKRPQGALNMHTFMHTNLCLLYAPWAHVTCQSLQQQLRQKLLSLLQRSLHQPLLPHFCLCYHQDSQ